VAGWTLLALVALTTVDYWTFPLLAHGPTGHFDRGTNGLWLRYTWYFGQHSPEEERQMARRLEQNRIRYAYFHVRYIKPDGTLRYSFLDKARELNRLVGETAPSVKRIAWIYIDKNSVNVRDEAIRRRLVGEAGRLVSEGGFQGVQWDYEICNDGDPTLLLLLDDSRRLLPSCWIGVAAPAWYPWPLTSVSWSERYFREVAQRSDQIAVMAYDSGLYHPRLYNGLVANQIEVLERATRGTDCRFVVGLPTYGGGTLSHNPHSENMPLALAAVKQGLADTRSERFEGVALFADYTTDTAEWDVFTRDWLSR